MTRQSVTSAGAPAAIGPYSQAIAVPGAVYCSGQIGLDPATGRAIAVTVQVEHRQLGAGRGVAHRDARHEPVALCLG